MRHEDTFAFQRGTVIRVDDPTDSEHGRRLTLRSFCVDNTVPGSLAVVKFWTEDDEYYEYTCDKLELVCYKPLVPLATYPPLPPPIESASGRLYAALQWLVDDMSDAGEATNPATGEVYDSVANARCILVEFGYLADRFSSKD